MDMDKVKNWICSNYPEHDKAVDNGYDIRVDEDELFEMMEAYSEYKNKDLTKKLKKLLNDSEAVIREYNKLAGNVGNR